MKLGIVCGYGNILDENLIKYVNSVIKSAQKYQIETLILTGGCSFTTSNTSEAKLMQAVFQSQNKEVELLLEEKAITTLHNLLYSKEIVKNLETIVDNLYIFCDTVRAFKILCLSKLLFKNINIKIIPIGRKETLLIYLIQVPSTFIQCLATLFPHLERKILIHKQKWITKYR